MAKKVVAQNSKKDTKRKSGLSEPKSVSAEIVDDDVVIKDEPEIIIDDTLPEASVLSKDLMLPEIEKVIDKTLLPAKVEKSLTTSDPLLTYLNEIRRYKLLTREEELQLARRYFDSKDSEAAQKLVQSNLRFVVKIAAEYSKFGSKMIDLIQEGNIGLMHAVRDFNPYKGVRLITYAVWWIRGYIQEYLMRQYSMVRIGTTQNQKKLFYQLQREKKALENLGTEESLFAISQKLGIPEDEVREMVQRMSGKDISLDKPVDEDGVTLLGDLQTSTDAESVDDRLGNEEELRILRAAVEKLRPTLTAREIQLLDERILADEPLTLQEIGEKYKITREAVRQMEARVMKKIKEALGHL